MDEPEPDKTPKTAGIPPAMTGPLTILQFAPKGSTSPEILAAATEVATYHSMSGDQHRRYANLELALRDFIVAIVHNSPPGPERSTAISRAREAKMWASAGVALEGLS